MILIISLIFAISFFIVHRREKRLVKKKSWFEWYMDYGKNPTFAKEHGWQPSYQKVINPDKPLKHDEGHSLQYHATKQLKKDYTQSLKDSVG